MAKLNEIQALKPIEPSELWTFESALSLLKNGQDQYILEALDEFLLNNKELFFEALPFKRKGDQHSNYKVVKDLSIRDVLYTNISATNNSDAQKISETLSIDYEEALRTISQVCKRIPERINIKVNKKLKSKIPDDLDNHLEEERIALYTTRILRDRRVILDIVLELLNNKLNPTKSMIIRNLGKEIFLSEVYINDVVTELKHCTRSLVQRKGLGNSKDNGTKEISKLDLLVDTESILIITELLKVLIELISASSDYKPTLVSQWFEFMAETNFMLTVGPAVVHTEPFNLIQGLATIASVLLLDVSRNFGSHEFMKDSSTFSTVNSCIEDESNINSIIMYVWSIILYRQHISEENTTHLVTINNLNQRAASLDVFQDVANLNELLKFDNLYAAILSQVIILAIPLVSIDSKIATTIHSVIKSAPALVIESFFNDESIVELIILTRAKFPIQILPYLKLSSINGQFAIHEFNNLKSFMSSFKKDQFEMISEIDDQNTELVKLTKDIDLYPPYESNKKLSLFLDSNTKAKVLPSGLQDEVLVTFLYKYNGWAFLGRILQNIVRSSLNNDDNEKTELVVDLIELLTQVVQDNKGSDAVAVLDVLDSLSAYTDDSDVIEILFRLFEQNLHSRNVTILVSLTNLFTSLVPLIDVKIWSYLSKSALLSSNGSKEGFASIIFGAIEMINGDYQLTIALIKLANALVQDCLGLEEKVNKNKSTLLSRFIEYLIQIFESFSHCRFNKAYQKMEIGYLIVEIFSNVLENVYSVDETNSPTDKVTKIFAEPSIKILKSFSIDSVTISTSRTCYPLLSVIDSILHFDLYESRDLSGYWFKKWVKSSLRYSLLILTICSSSSFASSFSFGSSTFVKSLFIKLPQLVDIYASHQNLRKEVLDLITNLTNGAATMKNSPPPSLLSHMGRDHSQVLLNSLISDLENSFDDYDMKISLYDFICAVLNGQQEGLSMLFISGRDVYGEITNNSENSTQSKSILSILKKSLRNIKYYPEYVSLHLVDAISLAFNSWTTIRGNDDDLEFVNLLLTKFNQKQDIKARTTDEYITKCYELKVLSKVTEILSVVAYSTRSEPIKNKLVDIFAKDEEFKFEFLKRFDTIGYNQRLHDELEHLFKENFNLDVSKFNSSLVKRNRFGQSIVYNLDLMDKIFGKSDYAEIWPSLREHVKACNANIQYLSAQIAVVKSHGALLTSFCKRFGSKLSSDWVFLASQLLFFNVVIDSPSEIFIQVYRERIELSFYILYTMTINPDVKPPLPENVLDIIKFSCDLLKNITGTGPSRTGNYKSLLRILNLSLALTKNDSNTIASNANLFIKLFELIITRGMKNLLIELQNDAYLIRTDKKFVPQHLDEKFENLSLILSILKEFVSLRHSASTELEMSKIVSTNDIVKGLMNLYSTLNLIKEGQLIFSQLTLMTIQELMTIDPIAQEFIEAGLFLILTSSSTSAHIQKGALSSLSPDEDSNYYYIWCNGLLPLVSLTFKNLGPQILPEVCMFMKSFQKQIATCIDRWSKSLSSIEITTVSISETRQILFFFQMLKLANVEEFLKSMGSPTQYTSEGEIIDMVLFPGLECNSSREEFANNLANLLKHPKFLSSRIFGSSPEEKQILEGKGSEAFMKEVMNEIRGLKDFLETEK